MTKVAAFCVRSLCFGLSTRPSAILRHKMAENKKSFILYCDQKGVWDKLDDAQAGRLIKHIISYVNDENPVAPDFITELAFEPIKAVLKRDLKKWENQQEQRRKAGLKSAEIRKRNASKANDRSTTVNERSISSTVNGNVSVSVNDNVSVSSKDDGIKPPSLEEVISYFDENGYTKESATKMFEYYEESRKPRGRVWKDGRGNTVKNWKQKARSIWFKDDNLKKNQQYDFKNFENVEYP